MRKIGPSDTDFVEKMAMTSIYLMGASREEKKPYKKQYFRGNPSVSVGANASRDLF